MGYGGRPAVNTSQLKEGRRSGVLAMKVGMLSVFDKWGKRTPVTALQVDNCRVVQVKKDDSDGYTAMQLSVGEAKPGKSKISLKNHYEKAGIINPGRRLQEFRVTEDSLLEPGTHLNASHFVPGQLVDVCGTSRGKGFAGVMKRWGFGGGRATHGNSLSHRSHGSTGNSQDPGKVFKGKKMAGRMGGKRRTAQNLQVVQIDAKRNVLYIKGSVPGAKGNFVRVVDAVMGPKYPEEPPRPTRLEEFASEPVFMPVGEEDPHKPKVPDNVY
jgi:large subunit ribosomal protein L3